MADYHVDINGKVTKKKTNQSDYYVDINGKVTKSEKRTFFKKGGNPLTSIGTTIGDMGLGVLQGAGNLVEGVVDLGMYGVSGVSKLVGADSFADDVKNIAKKNTVDSAFDGLRDWAFEDSYLGDRSVDVAKGVGYTAGMILTGGAAQAAGVGSAGVSALSTGTMFASSAGSGMSEAYQAGASDKEAVAYGAMKGAVDAGSELLFGGLGKAVNALGISRGISSLDDIVAKKLSSKISNKTFQLLTQYGVKASAEGFEEVLAGIGSAAAKKMTYMSDADLKQLIKDEDLMDQFVIGAISSGIMQGGDVVRSVVTGTDFITGLIGNEERVIKKEVENRINEREADGTKLSNKEKNKIQEQVRSDLEKGYISIDTIESALGGEDYENYIAATEQETALRKEYEELGKKQNATLAEQARYTKLEQQIEELKTGARSSKLKEQLGRAVEEIAKQDRLGESYNEKSRRSQAFTADLTKYNEKQQETVKRAAESGILNNTNRTHEFVDMLAKISADKGVSFDFTNNQKLKESGFVLEGKTVNGFLKEGNISLNIESAKALNSVVGHEITHVLEGTELYGELQQAVKVYAESKGEYGKRLKELQKLYEGVEGVNIENELTADIIGDYLFTDSDFVKRLSTEKPGLFRKIYEEIKYLLKSAITGSKQERELEKVKRTFEKAYKESGATSNGTRFLLNKVTDNKVADRLTSEEWETVKSSVANHKKLNHYFQKTTDGGIIIPVNNKLVYTDANMDSPGIRKIVEFESEFESDIDFAREEFYAVEKGESTVEEAYEVARLFTKIENINEYETENRENVGKYDRRTGRGKGQSDTYHDNFLQERIRRANETINSVNNEKASSQDGESAGGNARYSLGEKALEERVSGDALLDAQDLIAEIKDVAEISPNGYVTLYHRTTEENAKRIMETRKMSSKEDGIFFSTKEDGENSIGYGKGVVKLSVPVEKLVLDDIFSDEAHVRIPLRTRNDVLDISNYLVVKYSVSDSDGRQLSEEQREYFKESKVRDENGNLKVMYHGTLDASFTVFDPNRSDDGRSLFFTDSETVAKSYSGTRETFSPYENNDGNKAKNYKVYLNLKNPLIIDAQGDNWNSILFPKEFRDDIIEYIGERIVSTNTRTYSKYAYDRGYDGLIIKNVRDSGHYANEHEKWATSTVAIAFSPEQVKSVDNQNPTSDKDIRRSLGEDIGPVGNLNVRGKDIALEEIAPVQQSVPTSEDIGPVRKDIAPVKQAEEKTMEDIGPVWEDIVQKDVPNAEENAPAEQVYSPDELPVWDDMKKPEADTYTPEAESYPKKVTTVKERNAAKLQSLKVQLRNEQNLKEKSHASYNAEIRDLQSEYDSKKNKNTKGANELLDRIERRKNSRDNTDAYYEKRINDIKTKIGKMNTKEFKIAEQRMSKQEEYQTTLGKLMGDTSTWVDKKMGIYYKVNTLRRNLRDIVRDENGNRDIAKADAIYDELQGKYNHNEAKLNREANAIKEKYAELKITAEEDAYIQMLGEYRHNPDTTLSADVMKEYFEKHKAKIDTKKVDKVINSARQLYDELFRRVNATLEEQGMRPLEYREGYFPHFTDDKQSWLAKLLNWKTKKDVIPTDIAGLTETFKPVRSWQSFDKHRTGDSTDYSFKKGLDMYVQGALDWIYHIEDIQKRRAFENEIRYRHSDQGIKDKVEAIRNNTEYDASEVQDQIDLVYKEARNPLNNFISDFRTQTNTLAGKKSSMDRGTEEWTNRTFYSTMQNISNRVTANMVVGSFSSALTNFIPITQSWAQVSPVSSLEAMRDTIWSYIRKDSSAIDNSDFLTNRLRKSKNLYQSVWDKAIDKAGWMMEAIDNFTSQVVWRSKYLENMNSGMSENEAIKNADQFAENVMAGRSRGNNPTIFDAKNPFIKIATAFQLEVNNQYGYLFKDVPQDIKNEAKGNLLKSYAEVFIGAWLYNLAYSALTGRDAALDPIGIILDVMKDFGVGGDEEPEEPAEIVGNLTESVLEELPFVGGFLGGGRIPISSALPYKDSDGAVDALRDFSEDVQNWKDGGRENFLKEMSNPASYLLLPAGGSQIRKTIQGLGMFSDKHPIAGSYTNSGKLRFAVEDTPLSKLQAALFGQWSSKNAREYIEEGRSPLGEKQTQELVDTGLPMADYWKYRDGLKEQSGTQEKIEYIAGLDLPIATKNLLVNNAVDRKEPLDLTEYDNLSGYEEFDFFSKNKELYNFLQENGVSYWDYKILGEEGQKKYKELQKDSRKQKFLKENGISVSTYCGFNKAEKEAYDWAYKNQEKYQLSQVITKDVVEYKRFTNAINDIPSDKDENGNTISGSKKQKVIRYINNLNIDYGQKLILFRSLYDKDDSYNYEIVEYLNGREDISRSEMIGILESLGFTVHPDGRVTW